MAGASEKDNLRFDLRTAPGPESIADPRARLGWDNPAVAIYDSHSAIVYALMIRMVEDPVVAGEILKDSFLAIIQDPDAPVPSAARFLSHARRLARLWRERNPRRLPAGGAQRGIDIHSRPEAAALEMAYFDCLTIEQIAEQQKVAPAIARQRLITGMRRLRNVKSGAQPLHKASR